MIRFINKEKRLMEMFMMKFQMGELFCGPGGLAKAAKLAHVEGMTIEHIWANDIDEWACKTYLENIKPQLVICKDVSELEIEKLPKINAFAFGFPCNDFSLVGEKKGFDGEYGGLYTYGVQVLKHHEPDWFIAENVTGLTSSNDGEAFIKILRDLEAEGYNLTPHLYKFEEYGVPQARHRIIIVGIRKDLNLQFKVPKPTFDKSNWRTSRQALEEPPIPANAPNHEFTKHKKRVVEMLKHIPPGENAWYKGIPEHLQLKVKSARMSNIYKRLDPNLPAYTVTGSGGGGTHVYHYEEPRALTNRERARLQTFPDDYVFYGGKEAVRKQIGMAVPPMGAKVIIEAILKTFAGIEYDYVEAKWQDMIEEIKKEKDENKQENYI
jgi:DNA (cytosine-5)-methyltransferase 1